MSFAFDSIYLKFVPLIAGPYCVGDSTWPEPRARPTHPRPFEPVFHDVSARTLDHTAGDWIAPAQVLERPLGDN